MTNESDLERRAGKAPEDAHPIQEGRSPDPSDESDLRVAQPGEDPPGEDALGGRPRGPRE
jgi:hypothetical protein